MKVVILCGGRGSRIRNVAEDIPKPLISVGGYPILWHIMNHYASWGYEEFVLCLGYKGQLIKNFFLNYAAHTRDLTVSLRTGAVEYLSENRETSWKVTLADTGLEAQTGARVKKIRRHVLDAENFMLTYGDGVGNIDIDALLRFHASHGRVLTVSGVRPPGRFGEIMTNGDGRVIEFNEKPQAVEGLISGGFFVCRREIFDYLDERDDLVFEQEPMRNLVRDGQLMVYRHDGFWHPMDTYRDYQMLNGLFDSGTAPWVRS